MPFADAPLPKPRVLRITRPIATTGVSLPPALMDAARADAAARGLNLSSLVRALLLTHLQAVLVADSDSDGTLDHAPDPDPTSVRDAA